ncbi:hypothetical protein ACJJTC_014596 [Scirpophaga incertulas]
MDLVFLDFFTGPVQSIDVIEISQGIRKGTHARAPPGSNPVIIVGRYALTDHPSPHVGTIKLVPTDNATDSSVRPHDKRFLAIFDHRIKGVPSRTFYLRLSALNAHFTPSAPPEKLKAISCEGNKVNEDIYRHEAVEWATLYALAPVHAADDKHPLVMRNANSDVDIYSETANNTLYLYTSRANGAAKRVYPS